MELTPFLRARNSSYEITSYIRKQLTSARTLHSTTRSGVKPFLIKRIEESPYLQELLMRMFYNDYKIFGFDWPDFMQKSGEYVKRSTAQY
jgi:hypothetical protein